jgi:hypothetical protein
MKSMPEKNPARPPQRLPTANESARPRTLFTPVLATTVAAPATTVPAPQRFLARGIPYSALND